MTQLSPLGIGHTGDLMQGRLASEVELLGEHDNAAEVERSLVVIGLLPEAQSHDGLNNINVADGLRESPHELVARENENLLVDRIGRGGDGRRS